MIELDRQLSLEQCLAIIHQQQTLRLSANYLSRVAQGQAAIQSWVTQQVPVYGVTTGFGAFCLQNISAQDSQRLQENIIRSHAISVGTAMSQPQVRALLLMILLNAASGQTGISATLLQRYCDALKLNLITQIPAEGSVGYLTPEAFLAAALILGEGKIAHAGEWQPAAEVLANHQLAPLALQAKEGLVLVNSTNSVCAYALLALTQLQQALANAEVIAALSIQTLGAQTTYLSPAVHQAKPHPTQQASAARILALTQGYQPPPNIRLQEAMSIRSIAQIHGAVSKTLQDALAALQVEMHSCCDNPLLDFDTPQGTQALSNANPDATMLGLECDSVSIAAVVLAKCVERRSARLLEAQHTGLSDFLAAEPGLDSGFMIAQYTQAGLLNQMRVLSHSAVVDNTPTSGQQEDYVSMAYFAAQKALTIVEKLGYILAIEFAMNLQAYRLKHCHTPHAASSPLFEKIFHQYQDLLPVSVGDTYWQPSIEQLQQRILHHAL